ncbi:hypothetical protein FHX72_003190 [Pseudoclavibacter helvolus]|uniref:Integrase catalytic domain-containing protein n=1 Tax=Pseudoclavibacter helvolus TaxID=255205 RepID=A0A7W4URH6_9MICO|nr:hypothetical protein [Pseudoclavibacter helvolus]
MAFVDQLRAEGLAVESIVRVLREQGVQIAARTYRAWKQGRVSPRTVTDAIVEDAVGDAAWKTSADASGTRRRKLTPEGLYGRKKMTALIRRSAIADASRGAVDRAMRSLGLEGVTRAKSTRTTIQAKDGIRAGDLLNRDFTAPRPDHTWVTDFTYVRTWAGWVYVAFILDVFSQRIVAWHAQTGKHVDLVLTPLRLALWERERQGHPVGPQQLIHHSDAGSQGGFNRSSQHPHPEVFDGSTTASSRQGDSTEASVSRASQVPAAGRGGVLGTHGGGIVGGGSSSSCRRGARSRRPLVPSRWRHGTVRHHPAANRPLPLLRGA